MFEIFETRGDRKRDGSAVKGATKPDNQVPTLNWSHDRRELTLHLHTHTHTHKRTHMVASHAHKNNNIVFF